MTHCNKKNSWDWKNGLVGKASPCRLEDPSSGPSNHGNVSMDEAEGGIHGISWSIIQISGAVGSSERSYLSPSRRK